MNILLVDDDKIFIRKTVERIDWEKLGIQQVFTAENMEQACRIMETFQVDIVVTDVEMPQGSGLELLEWIAEKKFAVENIVISGYAHFAYAQKAMEYGSRKYMLKPVSSKEVELAIREILEENQEKHKEQRLPEHGFWSIGDRTDGRADVLSQIEKLEGYRSKTDLFRLVMLRILSGESREETERKLLEFAVYNIVRELFKDEGQELDILCRKTENEWILAIHVVDEDTTVCEELTRIQGCLGEVVGLCSCVYVDRCCCLDMLWRAYADLEKGCREVIAREGEVILLEEYSLSPEDEPYPDWDWMGQQLLEGDFAAAKKSVIDHVDHLVKAKKTLRHTFVAFRTELTRIIMHFMEETEVSFGQLFAQEEFARKQENAMASVSGMYEWIEYLMEPLEGAGYFGRNKKEHLVELARQYIDTHLGEDLSRKKLASYFHFSEDYLAKLFQGQTGQPISRYVMERRMERAKEYLEDTDKPISEIALLVGYSNFSYFSKSFKDYVGKVPGEYRMNNKNPLF